MQDEALEKMMQEWRNSIDEYAEAKAAAEYLREFRKSKKSILMIEAENLGRKTGQERETYAYSHTEYLELLEGLKAAVEKSESLRCRMVIAEKRIAVWQTQQANNRKERGGYGA